MWETLQLVCKAEGVIAKNSQAKVPHLDETLGSSNGIFMLADTEEATLIKGNLSGQWTEAY